MIVKNEEKIIERCIRSVLEFIDFFVIMDTYSTDNTVKKIKQIFDDFNREKKRKDKIKGIIFEGEFQNFSQARNQSLEVAYEKSNCHYILLMDADHTLVIPKESKLELEKYEDVNSFYITQIDQKLSYKNTRLVKNNMAGRYYYKGYTHEVLIPTSSKEDDKRITLPVSDIYIQDFGDGGSKKDKSDRDQRLLLQEISEIEKEDSILPYSRPYFYLANTYFGQKNLMEAEKYYRKRITLGGWKEELWYCYYKIGLIKMVQKNIPLAIYFLQSAIETNPDRLESFFYLLLILRDNRMDYNFQLYLQKSKRVYQKIKTGEIMTQDFLFYEKEITNNFIEEFIHL